MKSIDRNMPNLTLSRKLWQMNWSLILLILLVASIGFAMLYSAANGNMRPWASAQMMRFGVGFVIMIGIALVDIRIWLRYAYVIYGLTLVLLLGAKTAWVIRLGGEAACTDAGMVMVLVATVLTTHSLYGYSRTLARFFV